MAFENRLQWTFLKITQAVRRLYLVEDVTSAVERGAQA